jgi:parvulin-like peptidyl-prolyl isomerase
LRKSALDELIRIMLLYQKAVSQGLVISSERVESYIYEDLRKKKERFGTDEEFLAFLKRENVTLDELKDELSRQQIRQVSAKLFLEREFLANIKISEETRQAAVMENKSLSELKDVARIRQIYISFDPDAPADKERAHKRAEEALEKAGNSEDFGKLILEYSDDPNVQATGGIMNSIYPGMLFSEIDDVVFELELMKVSEIIEGPRGYHIIQVLDRLMAEEQIDNVIKNNDVERYIEELKSEFPVHISKSFQ